MALAAGRELVEVDRALARDGQVAHVEDEQIGLRVADQAAEGRVDVQQVTLQGRERGGDRGLVEGEAKTLPGADRRLVGGLAGGHVQAGSRPAPVPVPGGGQGDEVGFDDPDAAARELEPKLPHPCLGGLRSGEEAGRALAVVGVDGRPPAVPGAPRSRLEPEQGAEAGVEAEVEAAFGRGQEQPHRRHGRQQPQCLGRGRELAHPGEHGLVEFGRDGLAAHAAAEGGVDVVGAIMTFSAGSSHGSSRWRR